MATIKLDPAMLGVVSTQKRLAAVQNGTLSVEAYLKELEMVKVSSTKISEKEWVIDLSTSGLKDPSGLPLDDKEAIQVIHMLCPSWLQSAGGTIRVKGVMAGFMVGIIKSVAPSATIILEKVDRATSLISEIILPPIRRDGVKLVNPDSNEHERDMGNGFCLVQTSQIEYKRKLNGAKFDYTSRLELVQIDSGNPRYPHGRFQIYDPKHNYYAWVSRKSDLIDVD